MKNRGITLIALVVTIIVLIILAGISISLILGENGIIQKAKDAKIQTDIASIKEEIQREILTELSENEGNISDNVLEEILEKYGTLSEEEKLINKILTTTKGNHEIKVSDIFNGTTLKDVPKEPTITTVANAPDTIGFNKSNTYYVSWNLTNSPYQINEDTNLNGIAPSDWYNYTEGVNHWANIKTTGGGNDCYWVWIPRYAYKVPTKGNAAETIEIAFLKGTGSTTEDVIDETKKAEIETAGGFTTTPTQGNWVIHPAFTNAGNGGLGNLTGIWVAKYEASSSSVDTINLENGRLTGNSSSLAGTGGGTDTSLHVRVKPNVTSWRGLNVNGMFEVCQNLTTSGNSLQGTTNLDSHMMKNTEWGAVAYLSRSKYGKNSEVWNNPYYNNTTNYSPITGLCGNESNGKDNETTDITKTYRYNEAGGANASTTGNMYGIYDMAGGALEYVAGIYKGGKSNSNRSKLWDSNNSKYVDQYTETTGSQSTYYGNTNKYGDAVYETSSSGSSVTGCWDSSNSSYPSSGFPVFYRGGRASNGRYAGVFAFSSGTGEANTYISFRPVVLSSQP